MRRRPFRHGWLLWSVAAASCVPGPDREHVDVVFGRHAAPEPAPAPAAVVAFGRALFDRGVGGVRCGDCHDRGRLGQDGHAHGRDTPAMANVARQAVFGWDGARAFAAVVRDELATRCGLVDDGAVAAAVGADPELAAPFAAAFPHEAPTIARAVEALRAELATWTVRGRWDRYVEGDDAALDAAERDGLATFLAIGCAVCHRGRDLGGASVHRLGLAVPIEVADRGRELATGAAADRFLFRAPMLRLAARTGPWLHDGSVTALDAVVRLMAKHELGREITPAQVDAIVTFLRATAELDSAAAERP